MFRLLMLSLVIQHKGYTRLINFQIPHPIINLLSKDHIPPIKIIIREDLKPWFKIYERAWN